MTAPDLLARVREDIVCERAHFNHAGTSLTPRPVLARVQRHLELEAEIGGYEAEGAVESELDDLPPTIARLLGAQPSEVTVTESATAAWEWALWSMAETFGWGAGDRLLCDQFAYGTMLASLHRLHLARGVEIVAVSSGGDGTIDLDALSRGLDDRVRLVLVTHMPTHLGTITDATAVGNIIGPSPALYALDVAQTLGQMPIDVASIRCDIAFGPARKFLRAPRGTAVLHMRSDLADRVVPLTPSFGTDFAEATGTFPLLPGLRRFNQFEYCVAGRLGLGEAIRYALDIGLERIEELVRERSRAVVDLLSSFGVDLPGGPDSRGIVSFTHSSVDARVVQQLLSAAGVNVWVSTPSGSPLDARVGRALPSVRVSPHYVTNDDDLARLDAAMRSL
jgi:selenocysteine lyase/cysteine desulfurase